MQVGQYFPKRLLTEFVRDAAEARGITFETMSEDWVARLAREGIVRWVVGYQFDLNAAAASAIAQDKVATSLLLQRASVPVVEHLLVRSTPGEPLHVAELERRFAHEPFVMKPLQGTSGREVRLVQNVQEAKTVVAEGKDVAWAASPLMDLQAEYRAVMLDGNPLLVYEKTKPLEQQGLRFFNLGMSATAVDVADGALHDQITEIANRTCAEASLRLAAVDVVRTADDQLLVLEINDGIMMENYARQSDEHKERAAETYDAIVAAMFA